MRKCTRKCKIEFKEEKKIGENNEKYHKVKYSVYIYKHDTCMCYINEQFIYVLQASIYNVHAWRILYRNHFYELYA